MVVINKEINLQNDVVEVDELLINYLVNSNCNKQLFCENLRGLLENKQEEDSRQVEEEV